MLSEIIAEILEAQAKEGQDSTTVTTSAEVHDIPADIDLEVKLEIEDDEYYQQEEGEIEEIETEQAASALILLSQPRRDFNADKFKSLWEGTLLLLYMRYPHLVQKTSNWICIYLRYPLSLPNPT